MIKLKRILIIGFIILLIDQVFKALIMSFLNLGESISLIPNFFSITLLFNTGGAFSLFSGNTIFLIVLSFIVIYILYKYFVKDKVINKKNIILYGILFGGICGNLIDRIFRGYVIDYIDFNIFGFNYPVFNFADICIVVSIFMIFIMMYKGDKNEIQS